MPFFKKKPNIATFDLDNEKDYNQFIKESVNDGDFFKDSRDWYLFKYVSPISDRAFLIVTLICLISLIYITKTMGDSLFPLKVNQPIFIPKKNYEEGATSAKIIKLKPKNNEQNFDPEVQNFDDSILKFLLINYVKNREEFDFSKSNIEDVNKKFNRIKSNSNLREYKNFQAIMSKDNKNSPIQFFGKNVKKTITLDSIKFYRPKPKNLGQKILFFIANATPLEADIRFSSTTKIVDEFGTEKKTYEVFLAKIKYDYQPIFKNDSQTKIGFSVNKYVLYKVKNG